MKELNRSANSMPTNAPHPLRVAVDIGGTFTDGVATLSPAGQIWVGKTPTTPTDPGEAVSIVIADLLQQVTGSMGARAPKLGEVVHGTTLITNTLIERKGSRTALVTTEGQRDMLDIGRAWRYDIQALHRAFPTPLVAPPARVASWRPCARPPGRRPPPPRVATRLPAGRAPWAAARRCVAPSPRLSHPMGECACSTAISAAR